MSPWMQVVGLLVLTFIARSQGGDGVLVGAGYSVRSPLQVAPGQVISVFSDGVHANVANAAVTNGNPLPSALGGVSVVLHGGAFAKPLALPILGLQRVSMCLLPSPDCQVYTAVTVQLPYDMAVNAPGTGRPKLSAILSISAAGIILPGIEVFPVPDRIHILTGCDVGRGRKVCDPHSFVGHLDGTVVTSDRPAKANEELVLYAYGLGATSPLALTGRTTPNGDFPAHAKLRVSFDFRPNAGASVCLTPEDCSFTEAAGALTPGAVGRYEIRFKPPPTPHRTPPCSSSGAPPGVERISSNLTVTVVGTTSYDSAAICFDAK
jgi:uncharacterized protein (TIGR03437 family)